MVISIPKKLNTRCKNCGAELTREMKICCEKCGEPIPKENQMENYEKDFEAAAAKNINVVWESSHQRDWVLSTCRRLGLDSNHPGILERYKKVYKITFGSID